MSAPQCPGILARIFDPGLTPGTAAAAAVAVSTRAVSRSACASLRGNPHHSTPAPTEGRAMY